MVGANGGTMLGAFAGVGAVLLVFLLYIKNKGWWWGPVRAGISCCDEACPPVSARPVPTPPSLPHSGSPIGSPKSKLGTFLFIYKDMFMFILCPRRGGSKILKASGV
ncbi:hypothetical protein NQ315_009078 [Exocentrus adspersus]|uniref:Uncharacterized protein n=1 Tax=Exocentrus adspersus TaxID=1586481 RepID=A0AAV8WGP9_9CUCU|nr:hypothetical protein NQ315_009078 [Exocentrus adspersus]